MEDLRTRHRETQCVHAGHKREASGAIVTPIYQVSTFAFRDVDHGAGLFAGKGEGYIYTRLGNPTVEAVERAVSLLEGGYGGLGCGSGMAAIHTTFAALLGSRDHAVCSAVVYGPTQTLLANVMSRFGIASTFVDTSNLGEVEKAMRPARSRIAGERSSWSITPS
jgi:methionine-gamma-lyase